MRHKNLATTHAYLSTLVFWEDVKRKYDGLKNNPIIEEKTEPILNEIYPKFCVNCDHKPICNIKDQICSSEWATGCKFFAPKHQIKMKGVENSF